MVERVSRKELIKQKLQKLREAQQAKQQERQATAKSLKESLYTLRAKRRAAELFSREQAIQNNLDPLEQRQVKQDSLRQLRRADTQVEKTEEVRLFDLQQEQLDQANEKIAQMEQRAQRRIRKGKKGFSGIRRTGLAMRVTSNIDLLAKEDRIKMFKDAGYDPKHMPVHMARRVGHATVAAAVTGGIANAGRAWVAADKHIPVLTDVVNHIASQDIPHLTKWSIPLYSLAYGIETVMNLFATKRLGTSLNPYTTGLEATGGKLLPNWWRNTLAVIAPVVLDAFINLSYDGGLLAATDDPRRVLEANLFLTDLNVGYASVGAGVLIGMGVARRRKQRALESSSK